MNDEESLGFGTQEKNNDRSMRVAEMEKYLAEFLTFEAAIRQLAEHRINAEEVSESLKRLEKASIDHEVKQSNFIDDLTEQGLRATELGETFANKYLSSIESATARAVKAADALHDKPGGSRAKQVAIRALWASGKYASRDLCAEQECSHLNMSFSAARKALRGTPKAT